MSAHTEPASWDDREAGAPEALDPEVTLAMISAGLEAIRTRDADLYETTSPEKLAELLTAIYVAMRRESYWEWGA